MSFRDGQFSDLKVPLTWTAAVALIVAIVIGAALFVSDRRETLQTQAYGASRKVFDAADQPVAGVFAAPARWAGAASDYVKGYFFAVSENRRLKRQLEEMRQWRDVAIALRNTNARYEALLGLNTDPPIPMAAARVVLDARGPFANTRLANVGEEKGVKVGNPVMNERGLVGRVLGVTRGASRILLLTDVESKTPVLVDRTDARAILTGDGGPNPRLDYMRGRDPVKEGDRILSSGDGGIFPRGLPVGVAAKGLDGRWRVRLYADAGAIDYVRIMKFVDFSQLVNQADLARAHMPPAAPIDQPAKTQTVNMAPGASATPPKSGSAAPSRSAAPASSAPARSSAPASGSRSSSAPARSSAQASAHAPRSSAPASARRPASSGAAAQR